MNNMPITLALVGNPNCGKTTMFNAMTGSSQYVGNWPGVTVEKKEGKLKGYEGVKVTDLPGIYSLSPYTLEEVVSRNYLINERPSAIINLVDGTNIERNLYLTTQVMELGIPVVVALNMMDVVQKNGDKIDSKTLSAELGCPVIEVSALKGAGLKELYAAAVEAADEGEQAGPRHRFSERVERALSELETTLSGTVRDEQKRWYAIKLFERDEKVLADLRNRIDAAKVEAVSGRCEEDLDDDTESIITNERYEYISSIITGVYKKHRTGMTTSDKIDQIVTNRVFALPIFAAVMFLVYYISIGSAGAFLTDWTNDVLFGEMIPPAVEGFLQAIGSHEVLIALILDGILGGVGAVLGFVPQMLVLFFMLAILEDIGYMARVAFIMDRVFRRLGLSGKSFIPMLIGSGCGVPGVMASRTIEQDRDRKMTIMTTCFIPCGAKMPIIGMFAGALFGGSGLVAVSAYFIGIAAIIISGIILKKTKPFAGEPAPFVMELPAYHVPTAGNVLRSTWERGWSFIKRAGTIILLSSIVLWFLQGFGFEQGIFQMVEDNNTSLLATIGGVVAPIFAPLGFGNWKDAVATFTGLIAKEEVVATFGVLYGFAEVAEEGEEIWGMLAANFTPLSAYSFMIFNLLCAPCFAAIGAIRREMNNAKWTWAAVGYMCGLAYVASLIVYQIGGLFTGEASLGIGTIVAAAALAGMIWLLMRKGYTPEQGPKFSSKSAVGV